MKLTARLLLSAFLLIGAAFTGQAQYTHRVLPVQPEFFKPALPGLNVKTNLLYDATMTFNLGLEFRTGGRTSIDIPANYNPWKFNNRMQWRHFLVQPEFRLWTKETFRGHFFGLHGHYALYNVGNMPKPFSQYMQEHRFEGWLAGAGVSYGYRWNFNHRWAMEATVGVGYAYLDYDKYGSEPCAETTGNFTKHYFGPTKVGLNLIVNLGRKPQPLPVVIPVLPPVVAPIVVHEPTFRASFVTPSAETVKARDESGSAFLDFASGRSEINPAFRNNAAELDRMNELIGSVVNNPDATVTGITITGFASPEGTYAMNMTLSERRAQALKNHIRNRHGFPDRIFSVRGAGEDWTTLEKMVEQSDIRHREQILAIIRHTGIFDGRERQLMDLAGGVPYRQMLAEMFPLLRRVEYRVEYNVRPFTVEQGREVFRTRPANLSLNEMFLLANTYTPGSTDFNEVFETAARIFPDSDVANLNAAASALSRNDATQAARYLGRVSEHNAYYWNNMGMLLWLQGNKTGAANAFARAGEQGAANAAELQKHFRSIER
jgi:hypothetical protein